MVAVDQLEELFAPSVAEDERRAFVEALVEAAWDPERRALVVLALRADFFGRLARLRRARRPRRREPRPARADERRPSFAARSRDRPSASASRSSRRSSTRSSTTSPASRRPAAALDGARRPLARARRPLADAAAYERTGGVRGAVGRHAEAAFRSLDDDEQHVARPDPAPARRRRRGRGARRGGASTRAELDADDDARVARVLATLVERRLLVADDGTVELVHEALLEQWPRLARWLEEDAHGRRLHRQLTQAASEWEASGREPSELYRGARLAAALEWADAAGDDAGLNRLEREFLEEASRDARGRSAARATGACARLLAAALVAAPRGARRGRASRSRHAELAQRQATAAIAQRLGAQALVEPRLDRALLLAREGVSLDDSARDAEQPARGAAARAPRRSPSSTAAATRVLDDALSPTGGMLAVARRQRQRDVLRHADAARASGRGSTARGKISYCGAIVRPVRALAFSPDGRTLAVGDSDATADADALPRRRTHPPRPRVARGDANAVTADVAFAPDGRTLVTGEAVSCAERRRPTRCSSRATRPTAACCGGRERSRGGRLVGFTTDGRSLLVTSGETTSFLLDARTFARGPHVPRLRRGGALAGRRHGRVRRGRRQRRARSTSAPAHGGRWTGGRPGRVLALAFSRDGKVLATTSDDGSVGDLGRADGEPARALHRPRRRRARRRLQPPTARRCTPARATAA